MTTNPDAFAATPLVLLTGASGYVGGRLLKSLENQGCRVRCLARRPAALKAGAGPSTEVVAGDVLDRASLDAALRGVDVAYYLVHSMGSDGSFEQVDRQAAQNFGGAAKAASFIWEAWATPTRRSPCIFEADTTSGTCCGSRACRCSSFVHRSSSGRAASRSR